MRSLLKRFSNLSMLWKFTIIYFILIMVPTAAIWISYYNWSLDSARNQSDKVIMQTINGLKQNVIYLIKNTENIAEEIAFSSDLQTFLNNEFAFTDNEVYYFVYNIQNKLINIKHLYPNKYYKIRVYSGNSSIDEEYDIIYSIQRIKDKDFFKRIESSQKRMFWGKIKKAEEYYDINEHISPKQNKDVVIPLYERIEPIMSNKMIGILEIDILIEKMFGEASDLRVGKNGFIIVFDSDGDIISPVENNISKDDIKIGMFSDDSGINELKLDNKKHRVVYDTIKEAGFKILALVPEKDIINLQPWHRSTPIFVIVFGMAVVFFITYFTTNVLFSRFKLLLKMMKRIEDGEFDVRIDESRKDEVGMLARGFNQMAGKLEQMILNLIEKETAQRDAEVRALQSQINPHFLYNTLESLRMENELRGQEDLADALASLGKLLRYSIKWFGGLIPLSQEIDHVNNYITIMKVRFRGKIDFKTNISEEIMTCPVIKMMLQPLVENCFQHGFKNKEGIWQISINARIEGKKLVIRVVDNGTGIDSDKLSELNWCLSNNRDIEVDKKTGSSIGIWNVNKRIKMQFGDAYGITMESLKNIGTDVVITLPAGIL